MAVNKTEVVTPILNPQGYIVVSQNTTTGAIALVGTSVYKTQALAKAALETEADGAQSTTRYVILRVHSCGSRLATVT